MKKLKLTSRLTFLTMIAFASTSWAQTAASGGIAGTVRDASGAVLPGVTVDASSPGLIEKVRTVISDSHGEYKILELLPGTFSVTFTLPGFKSVKREGLELSAGVTLQADAEMTVGALEETITVSGASPVVDVQNVRSQSVLTRELLDRLPTGKTVQGYAALTIGMEASGAQDVGGNKGEQTSRLAIHGSHASELRYFQDGLAYTSPIADGGSRQFMVNQVSVREVAMSTGAADAETETGGVQVHVVPKDGGNRFSGIFSVSGTDPALQADNLSSELMQRGLSTGQKIKKMYDAGGGFGGPILRDKVWFYTGHRWWAPRRLRLAITLTRLRTHCSTRRI